MFEKSKLMLRYEKETGKPSTRMIADGCHCYPCIEVWHYEYVAWLESKIRTDNSFDVINHLTVDSRTDEIRQFMETGEGKDKNNLTSTR